MKRATYIEGYRGLACIMVFLSHFGVMFFPNYYWDFASDTDMISWLGWRVVGQSPLSFMLNGHAGVVAFLIITGFGVCTTYRNNQKHIKALLVNRYFKLLLISFLAVVGIILLAELGGVYYKDAAIITKTPWLGDYSPEKQNVWLLLLKNPLASLSEINGVLWTMKYFLISPFIIFLICFFTDDCRHKKMIYLMATFVFLNMEQPLYICSIVGAGLADLQNIEKCQNNRLLHVVLLVLGIFFGGYPTGLIPQTFWYAWLPYFDGVVVYYHLIGMTMLFISVLRFDLVRIIMESRLLQFAGKHSMLIYVIHFGVIVSFSSWFAVRYLDVLHNYTVLILLDFFLTSLLCLGISIIVEPLMKMLFRGMDRAYHIYMT